jgi:hypothetical protein
MMFLRLAVLVLAVIAPGARAADPFDLYTNPVLARAPGAKGVEEVEKLTPEQITDNDRVLPGLAGALVVVKTNDNRWGKLLVQAARQKVDADTSLPMLLVHRFVTFKEGQEQAVQASAQNVCLFPGFRLNLDLGQVVPEQLGGDLRLVVDGETVYAEPLGKARLFLVTRPLPEAAPKKGEKLVVGEKFEPRYFNGTYRLHDDGRRSGKLTLEVKENGDVTGAYYSDKDGEKYAVRGQVGKAPHSVEFTVQFPRTEQFFRGWLFTGDARALAGTSRIGDREAGFYAVRVEE